MALPYTPPKIKVFSDPELLFWNQYGITESLLNSYEIHSVSEFFGYSNKNSEQPQEYSVKSTNENPIFGYLFSGYAKVYLPFAKECALLMLEISLKIMSLGWDNCPRKEICIYSCRRKGCVLSCCKGICSRVLQFRICQHPKSIIERLSYRFKHIALLYDSDETGRREAQKQCERPLNLKSKIFCCP